MNPLSEKNQSFFVYFLASVIVRNCLFPEVLLNISSTQFFPTFFSLTKKRQKKKLQVYFLCVALARPDPKLNNTSFCVKFNFSTDLIFAASPTRKYFRRRTQQKKREHYEKTLDKNIRHILSLNFCLTSNSKKHRTSS